METLFVHALIFAAVRLLATAITTNLNEDILSIAYTVLYNKLYYISLKSQVILPMFTL